MTSRRSVDNLCVRAGGSPTARDVVRLLFMLVIFSDDIWDVVENFTDDDGKESGDEVLPCVCGNVSRKGSSS